MNTHRYTLEPYKGPMNRYKCPSCNNRAKTFVRYIDTQTGGHLAAHVGKCNRANKCGYHYPPKLYFEREKLFKPDDKSYKPQAASYKPEAPRLKKACGLQPEACSSSPKSLQPISEIPAALFTKSLAHYEQNNFITWLLKHFTAGEVTEAVNTYCIGTSRHWNGANVFWQIDAAGRVRAGKVMLYNAATGRRVKEPYRHVNWVHKVARLTDYKLSICLFGEHLLHLPGNGHKRVCIVESEKTAVVASILHGTDIWLAAGALGWLTFERCQALKGRTVKLYPDVNAYDLWMEKAKELSAIAACTVSALLERRATAEQRAAGLDIADFLLG